jgi:ribosomal protein L7/L12
VSDTALVFSVVALLLSVIAITVALASPSGRSSAPSDYRLDQLERRVDALASHTGAPAPAEPEWMSDVQALLDDGEKIQAIKLYREMTGAGLADAKYAVEEMARPKADA